MSRAKTPRSAAPSPSAETRDVHVLPFVREARPAVRMEKVLDIDGVPVLVVGERWRDADAAGCPYAHAMEPDPAREGEWIVMYGRSLTTGTVSFPLTPAEIESWWACRPGRKSRS